MALSGDSRTRHQVDPDAFGVLHAPPPYAYRCPYGSSTAEECGNRAAAHVGELIDEHQDVAAVIMEPNAGTNGIVAPANYWPALRAQTRSRNVYLIADEVMSGFGRCGEWFAWQRYGEEGRPDLMTLAKGLTGAHLPLGAVVLSAELSQRLEREMLYTGLTYCGHPLACAAGVAAIEAYGDERLIERSRSLGALDVRALESACRQSIPSSATCGAATACSPWSSWCATVARANRSAAWPESPPALKHLVRDALQRDVSFAIRGNLILLAPPLVIAENELGDALTLLDELLAAVRF